MHNTQHNIVFQTLSSIRSAAAGPWNNGKEVPRCGVAEIHKMSPSTNWEMLSVIVVTNSPPIGDMRSQLTNH